MVNLLEVLDRVLGDGNEKSRATRFGIALTKRIGRISGGRCIQRSTMQKGCSRFKVERVVDVGGPSLPPHEKEFQDPIDEGKKMLSHADSGNVHQRPTGPPSQFVHGDDDPDDDGGIDL